MKEICEHIEDMLAYKESLGYSRRTYEGFLKDFAAYLNNYYSGAIQLSEDMALGWCVKRDSEKGTSFRKRAGTLREFTKYLYAVKASEFILPTNYYPAPQRYTPYIFSDKELADIFDASDCEVYDRNTPCRHLIISAIYRLIYFCGLRPNEGRELKKRDIDLNNGTLFIRKNKAHRERLIPMASDVTDMCRNYYEKISMLFPDTEYFFPSPDGNPYSARWLTIHFLKLWNTVKPAGNSSRVRIYDLRHRYATTIMMNWMNNNEDLYTMFPYLSSYMGHTHFEDTVYYIHLLPENLLNSPSIDWAKFSTLIPEVHYEK
jgi:integrase/recombinase XerD